MKNTCLPKKGLPKQGLKKRLRSLVRFVGVDGD